MLILRRGPESVGHLVKTSVNMTRIGSLNGPSLKVMGAHRQLIIEDSSLTRGPSPLPGGVYISGRQRSLSFPFEARSIPA